MDLKYDYLQRLVVSDQTEDRPHLLVPYVKLAHEDPLFSEFTYGDVNRRGHQLKKLKKGSLVFFHTTKRGNKVITAFYVVDRAIDTAVVAGDELFKRKYSNPHIEEFSAGKRKHDEDVILFGDPIASFILEKPLLFDRRIANKLSLNIKFPPDKSKSDAQILGSATRAWRKLTEADKNILLDEICSQDNQDHHLTFRSSEEVAETRETDIETYIVKHPHLIGNLIGNRLRFLRRQQCIGDGRLDILFEDESGNWVVIEVKFGSIGPDAIEQARNYIRDLSKRENKKVSGVVVCAGVLHAYEERLRKQKEIRILIHGWNLGIQSW